jgi:hypothetical protein
MADAIATSKIEGYPAHRLDAARDALTKSHSRMVRAAARSGQAAPPAPVLVALCEPYVSSRCRRCGETSRGWSCNRAGCEGTRVVTSIELVDVEVTGARPALAGWEFLACVEPLEGGNLIRQVPGASVVDGELSPWREGAVRCDHCATTRRRTETFVVRADGSDPAIPAGTHRQVGRNCLAPFLGGRSPAAIVEMLGWAALVREAAGEEDEGGGWFGRAPSVHDPLEFLGWVCGVIRADGWRSRGAARDAGDDKMSTSDMALRLMGDPPGGGEARSDWQAARDRCAPTPADLERAAAALAWAREIEPTSDYERNLSLVARQAIMKLAHAGILASAASAHARVLGREVERRMRQERSAAQPSEHVGEVGQRVDLELTVERVIESESQYGALRIMSMRDASNNLFVWKTGSRGSSDVKAGQCLKIRGKVKRHGEFRGEKQTELTRCEIFEEWPAKPAKPARKSRAKKAKSTDSPRWRVGDRVSFSASPSSAGSRLVRTGSIERIVGKLAHVIIDEIDVSQWVSLSYLHVAGAYTIAQSGPIGIQWTDDGQVTRGRVEEATAASLASASIIEHEPRTPTHRSPPAAA